MGHLSLLCICFRWAHIYFCLRVCLPVCVLFHSQVNWEVKYENGWQNKKETIEKGKRKIKLEKIKNNKVLLHDIRLPSRKCSLKRCNTKDPFGINTIKRLWSRIQMSALIQTHEIFPNFIIHIVERLENQKITREIVWLYVIGILCP